MKSNSIFTYSLILMILLSLSYTTTISSENNDKDLSFQKISNQDITDITDNYSPILESVLYQNDSTLEILRERNETIGEGGIYEVQEDSTVKFSYVVALQNITEFDSSDYDFKLFADLPVINDNTSIFYNGNVSTELSLTNTSLTLDLDYTNTNSTSLNYTHPISGSILPNATLYFFETNELNVSVSHLPFYVADINEGSTLSEILDDKPLNLLTTQQYYTTESQDDFYVQTELVNLTGSLFSFKAGDALGINYNINEGSSENENFTLIVDGANSTGLITLLDYEPGTTINWESVFYTTDTLVNLTRTISGLDKKSVEVGDGSPSIDIDINPNHANSYISGNSIYSFNDTITFTVTANVPKGNITSVTIDAQDSNTINTNFSPVNGSLQDIDLIQNVVFDNQGQFNVTIEAITDKEFNVNSTFIIYVDQTAPSIQKLEAPDEINSNDGLVNFNFTFSDENSGVFLAILDLGNGQSIEVTNQNSIEYRYKTSGVYQYELIITDFAGNQVSQTGVLALTFNSGLEDDSASSFGVFIFFIVFIALITSWVWGPKLSENFSFDTIKNLFNKK